MASSNKNGDTYRGSFNYEGYPEGQGCMTFASGDKYLGQFYNGVPYGKGVATYKNGDRFEG